MVYPFRVSIKIVFINEKENEHWNLFNQIIFSNQLPPLKQTQVHKSKSDFISLPYTIFPKLVLDTDNYKLITKIKTKMVYN